MGEVIRELPRVTRTDVLERIKILTVEDCRPIFNRLRAIEPVARAFRLAEERGFDIRRIEEELTKYVSSVFFSEQLSIVEQLRRAVPDESGLVDRALGEIEGLRTTNDAIRWIRDTFQTLTGARPWTPWHRMILGILGVKYNPPAVSRITGPKRTMTTETRDIVVDYEAVDNVYIAPDEKVVYGPWAEFNRPKTIEFTFRPTAKPGTAELVGAVLWECRSR